MWTQFYFVDGCFILWFLFLEVFFSYFSIGSCEKENNLVSQLNFSPPVFQPYGFFQDKIQFHTDPPCTHSVSVSPLNNIQQIILQRVRAPGNCQAIPDTRGVYAGDQYGREEDTSSGGGMRSEGDNGKLILSGLRKVETFPRQNPIDSIITNNIVNQPVLNNRITNASPSIKEDVSNKNKIATNVAQDNHINFHMEYGNSSRVKSGSKHSALYKDTLDPRDNATPVRPRIDKNNALRGNAVICNVESQNVKTQLRVQKNKDNSEELPEKTDTENKRIIKIITRTKNGFLNTATGIVNLIQPSNSGMSTDISDTNKTLDNDINNCAICKEIDETVTVKNENCIETRSKQRDVVDPNCEFCIRDYKLRNSNTKLENEYYKRPNEKISSNNEYNIMEKEGHVDKVKIKVTTTCRTQDCIRRIKELLDNLETSTSYKTLKDKLEEYLPNKKNRDEDNQFTISRKTKYTSGEEDYESPRRTKSTVRKTITESTSIQSKTHHYDNKYEKINKKYYDRTDMTRTVKYSDKHETRETNHRNKIFIDHEDERTRRRNDEEVENTRKGKYSDRENTREKLDRNRKFSDDELQGGSNNNRFIDRGNQKEKIRTTSRYDDDDDEKEEEEEERRRKKKMCTKKPKKKKKRTRKRHKKHERQNRSGKKYIREDHQDEGKEDHENRRMNYAKANVDTDDSVQKKANNLRFILLEKIKAQNEEELENEDYTDEEEDDHYVEGKYHEDYDDSDQEEEEEAESQIDMAPSKNKKTVKSNKHGQLVSKNEKLAHYVEYIKDKLRYLIEISMNVHHKLYAILQANFDHFNLEEKQDTLILCLLVVIIVLLIGVYMTLKKFNKAHQEQLDLVDSEAKLEWVSLNMKEKGRPSCSKFGTQQTYCYEEIQRDDLYTGPSYSEILKDLYLPNRSYGSSEASLLPLEFGDEEPTTRKILHGKRICGKSLTHVKKDG